MHAAVQCACVCVFLGAGIVVSNVNNAMKDEHVRVFFVLFFAGVLRAVHFY